MAVPFPGFPWWFWGGGNKEKQPDSNGSETVKFQTKISQRKGKTMIDKECDVVVIRSDGVYLSGYDSEAPEWSIGWEEPHGPGFQGPNEDDDGGFAVLVPSYRPGCKELVESPNNQLLSAIQNLPTGFSSEGNSLLQPWFSSFPNF